MTREQLEANWGWDPKRGSIPFQRPRLTPGNIADQKKLARPGTLIHWAGKPCARGKRKTDQRIEAPGSVSITKPRMEELQLTHGTVTYTALAGHIGNVNCLACRKTFFGVKGYLA